MSICHRLCMFAGGLLFGTAGIAVLKSNDAKKVYTHCTAAVLRGKDSIIRTGNTLKENCEDIYADAANINEERYRKADEAEIERARALIAEYDAMKAKEEEDKAEE